MRAVCRDETPADGPSYILGEKNLSQKQTLNTSLANTSDDPVERTSILDVYRLVTGYSATDKPQSGGKFLVRCPVDNHEDKSPSCSLNPKTDSWNCFACEGKGGKLKMIIANGKARTMPEAAEWLKTFIGGIDKHEYKPQPELKKHQVRNHEELINERRVGVHPYKDDKGRTVYEVLRFQGKPAVENARAKRFSQRLIGNDGKWIWTFEGQNFKRWPYKIAGVMKAASEKKTLVALEGEIHCDALEALDIHTTTLAEGWKAKWESSWNTYLDGIPLVFVLADAERIGRKSAAERAEAMAGSGRKAVVIDIFPERENGDDILNWMIEEGIIHDYRDVTKINTPFNWKRMYRVPLDEARARVIAKLTQGYKNSTTVFGGSK